MRYLIILSVGLLLPLAACTSVPGGSSSSSSSSSVITSSVASANTLRHYVNPGIGYSIDIPAGWTTEDKDVVTEAYQTHGTAFIAPTETGTTLDEAYFHVGQMSSCPSFPAGTPVTIAGTSFHRSSWDGVGAGNLYQGISYTGAKDGGCLVLTGYLHSCNLGPDCGENHSVPFNKEAYFSTFDAMARSVQFLAHPGD